MFIGLDGYRHGWVAVSITGGRGAIEFLAEIGEIRRHAYDLAMIDIPIGLPHSDYRACDVEARKLLGRNCNRVFLGARRPLLDWCHSHEQANKNGKSLGAGVSRQLFCLFPKIKEVDEFVRNETHSLKETHPELVFWRLKGRRAVTKKTSPEGQAERISLLKNYIGNIDELLRARLGREARIDDVLDACACAVAAMDYAKGERNCVPVENANADGYSLDMRIWF